MQPRHTMRCCRCIWQAKLILFVRDATHTAFPYLNTSQVHHKFMGSSVSYIYAPLDNLTTRNRYQRFVSFFAVCWWISTPTNAPYNPAAALCLVFVKTPNIKINDRSGRVTFAIRFAPSIIIICPFFFFVETYRMWIVFFTILITNQLGKGKRQDHLNFSVQTKKRMDNKCRVTKSDSTLCPGPRWK